MSAVAVSLIVVSAILVCTLAGQAPSNDKGGQVTLTYMGTAAWEITDGNTVILVDPYLSRISGPQPPGRPPFARTLGDNRPQYGWADVAVPDTVVIDSHIKKADFILVTHTHYDHVLDVPHIALKTHASVIGTESTENVARSYGVPEDQLITVRGGEDYAFGAFSLKVVPSLHSPLDHKHYFSSATDRAGMKAPLTLEQMHPEGGTLAYLIRIHGHQILAFGGMNYIESEMEGLTPDAVLVGAASSRQEIYDYTGRLLRDLHFPALVLPTHWDNFTAPYGASRAARNRCFAIVRTRSHCCLTENQSDVPKYFEPISLDLPSH